MALILVDGSALVYRAYYAFANRPLTAPSGEYTSVAFGFLNSLLHLIELYDPTHLSVVFDVKGKTFRHDIYADYKANRKPMPEDLAVQMPRLRELLGCWGICVQELPGFEADDVMATVAMRSREVCPQVWFYTGDKDFMQLLDERTGMLKPGRSGDEISPFTLADVKRVYKLEPAALIDVFALAGDKSDNIPGAPGVGDKTALKLIHQFGSLENLFAQLADTRLTPRLQRVLREHEDQVRLSRRLFTIDTDVPVPVNWKEMQTHLPTGTEVTALLQELGLRRVLSFVERLARQKGVAAPVATSQALERPEPDSPPESAATTRATGGRGDAPLDTRDEGEEAELLERGYRICHTAEQLRHCLGQLAPDGPLAVDTETDSLRPDTARLVGISLAAAGCPGIYVPVLRREDAAPQGAGGTLFPTGPETSELAWVCPLLSPVLADPRRQKIGQNLKFDHWILARHGMPLAGPRFDTLVAAYVLDPGRQRFKLEELAREYLQEDMIPYAALFEAKDRRKDILTVPLTKLGLYAAEDADVTYRLYEVLAPALADAGLEKLFTEIEMPLAEVLFAMESSGIKIDLKFLDELRRRFATQMQQLTGDIHAAAGEEFNIQSPSQLSRILFDKFKLKPRRKTATGYSTDVAVLSELASEHPLPGLVLEYRQLAKLQSTYVESLPQLVNPETGLIHTSYHQAVAVTGRLSSSDPNLQNIPVRTELGRQIRRAFIPRAQENMFLSADYSQIELRLLAHLSGDEHLTAAFVSGGDVHRRTAALIAGIAEDSVTPEMRNRAKAINFGVIYGMGAVALGRQISVPTSQAKAFIETYFATYPGVRRFIEQTKEHARRMGYVETLLGRRRHLPDILSGDNRLRSFQERIAVNTPIQGTAADLIKLAMIHIQRELTASGLRSMLLLQVHDELVLEVPRREMLAVRKLVKQHMEGAMRLRVPLIVDLHEGRNWAEAHD